MNYKKQLSKLISIRKDIGILIDDRNDFNGVYVGKNEIAEFMLYVSMNEFNGSEIEFEL